MTGVDRLRILQGETILAGLDMEQEAGRFRRLASRHEDGTAPRAVSAWQLFQTPAHIAESMVLTAKKIQPAGTALEPSAGLGRIFRPMRAAYSGPVDLVETDPTLAAELKQMTIDDAGTAVHQADWMTWDHQKTWDVIIMNPPFQRGTDVKHILKASRQLNPGGVLVALCYNGAAQNRHLRPIADTWTTLPANSFRESNTRANVAMLVMRK